MTTTHKRSLLRGAGLAAAGLGTAILLTAAAPAMARGGDMPGEKCGAGRDISWQPIDAVSQKLEAEGYTDFLRITRDDGCYEVIARKGDARPMKLWLNPASLDVTGFSKIPPKHFRGGMGKHGGPGKHQDRAMRMQGQRGEAPAAPPAPEQPAQPQKN